MVEQYSIESNWFIDGVGYPDRVSVSSDRAAVELFLNSPLQQDTVLHLGPFRIGEKMVEDSYPLSVGGDRSDEDCDCSGLSAETRETHDHFETEQSAWAYEISEPPGCSIWFLSHVVEGAAICNDDPLQDYWQDEDGCGLSSVVEDERWLPWATFRLSEGVHTMFIPTNGARKYTAHLRAGCPEGEPPWEAVLCEEFRVDTINPYFVEEPRIVYGPEAAEWLRSKIDISGAHVEAFTYQNIASMEADICGCYVLVDIYDFRDPGAIGGFDIDVIDRFGNYEIPSCVGLSIGGGVWIDHNPLYFDEQLPWPDETFDPLEVGPGVWRRGVLRCGQCGCAVLLFRSARAHPSYRLSWQLATLG